MGRGALTTPVVKRSAVRRRRDAFRSNVRRAENRMRSAFVVFCVYLAGTLAVITVYALIGITGR